MTTRMVRSVFLLVAAMLIVAPPAAAQEKVCVGQDAPKPPPTPAEKEQAELEGYAEQRAEFGFRHDLPYVKELIRRGVWEYDVGYIPVTPAENRYLKLRDELDFGAKGDRYLREHREDVGTISVEDDWPREPYLLVRFKRNVSEHLRALKRVARYPDNVRAIRPGSASGTSSGSRTRSGATRTSCARSASSSSARASGATARTWT